MVPRVNGAGESSRRNSIAPGELRPAEPGKKSEETESAVAANEVSIPPRQAAVFFQPRLPLSACHRMDGDSIRHIAGFLTYSQAVWLMLADRRFLAELKTYKILAAIAEEFRKMDSPFFQFRGEEIENLLGRFAAARLPGRTQGLESLEVDHVALGLTHSDMLQAVYDGKLDVEYVRAGLSEFLGLPVPNAQKVLRLGRGVANFEGVCQRMTGKLEAPECRQHEALTLLVREIAGSPHLLDEEASRLCAGPGDRPYVAFALRRQNPVAAACIILGIARSHADPARKQYLLEAMSTSFAGPGDCLDRVIESLEDHAYRAPQWIGDLLAELRQLTGTLLRCELQIGEGSKAQP